VVERLKREHDAQVAWKPFFLRPDTPPEGFRLSPQVRARFAGANERLKHMAHAAGMEMVQPEIIPNSRRALEATEYAREHGKQEEFHRVVFRKFYGEGQDLNQWSVLLAAAEEVGVDVDAMQREVESGKYHEVLDDEIGEAYALGINAIPTYVLNDKYAIVGAQPYEVFEGVLARLAVEHQQDDKPET
jgi:predicted DsbA family dithiol-disulfide isomerase